MRFSSTIARNQTLNLQLWDHYSTTMSGLPGHPNKVTNLNSRMLFFPMTEEAPFAFEHLAAIDASLKKLNKKLDISFTKGIRASVVASVYDKQRITLNEYNSSKTQNCSHAKDDRRLSTKKGIKQA